MLKVKFEHDLNKIKMKKLITILITIITASCGTIEKCQRVVLLKSGQVINIMDYKRLYGIADTIIISRQNRVSTKKESAVISEIYGIYNNGIKPNDTTIFTRRSKAKKITYHKGVFIKTQL